MFAKHLLLVHTLNINYVNISWASTNKTKIKKLFEKQKQAGRIIYN